MKVFVALLLCLAVAASGRFTSRLDYYEGEICREKNGSTWTCKKLNQCPKAQDALNTGKRRPLKCSFNEGEPDDVVCCEPQAVRTSPVGTKSIEMCRKYAESVFVKEVGPFGEGFVLRDTCGAVEPLVTNGMNAAPMEYPHMALIGYGEEHSIEWLCGGTLISDQFVLSAAHCSNVNGKGPARWVRLGEYNVQSREDEYTSSGQARDYAIIETINHPEYRTASHYHDIALYKLPSKVEFSVYVRPICLQTGHQFPKSYAIVTGWGRKEWGAPSTDILQKANLTITQRKQCTETYRNREKLQHGLRDDIMFCAGDIEHDRDACQSDSGGPLQNRLADPYCMYMQVGITSFGIKCAARYPAVYTRVSYYVPWIESVVWP